jgi:25S rRNA (adenine2142-N1)-methyltransferase
MPAGKHDSSKSITGRIDNAGHSKVISKYHALLKQLAAVDSNPLFRTGASKLLRKSVLQAQIDNIGIDKYQMASRAGESKNGGVDCSAWVSLEIAGSWPQGRSHPDSLSLLDIGAIVPRFSSSLPGGRGITLDVTSIDLNPQDPSGHVERADFFNFAVAAEKNGATFDVLVLSLVLNFVPLPSNRGKMLSLAHRIASSGGLLFLVLPLACLTNSRYCDEALLANILAAVGWSVTKASHTDKLARFVCKKAVSLPGKAEHAHVRRIIRGGASRNNFLVLLPGELSQTRTRGAGSAERRARHTAGVSKPRKARKASVNPPKGAAGSVKLTSNQRRRARRDAKRGVKRES